MEEFFGDITAFVKDFEVSMFGMDACPICENSLWAKWCWTFRVRGSVLESVSVRVRGSVLGLGGQC